MANYLEYGWWAYLRMSGYSIGRTRAHNNLAREYCSCAMNGQTEPGTEATLIFTTKLCAKAHHHTTLIDKRIHKSSYLSYTAGLPACINYRAAIFAYIYIKIVFSFHWKIIIWFGMNQSVYRLTMLTLLQGNIKRHVQNLM